MMKPLLKRLFQLHRWPAGSRSGKQPPWCQHQAPWLCRMKSQTRRQCRPAVHKAIAGAALKVRACVPPNTYVSAQVGHTSRSTVMWTKGGMPHGGSVMHPFHLHKASVLLTCTCSLKSSTLLPSGTYSMGPPESPLHVYGPPLLSPTHIWLSGCISPLYISCELHLHNSQARHVGHARGQHAAPPTQRTELKVAADASGKTFGQHVLLVGRVI